ncbi:hypothetical protein CDCA_CDCA03G0845 [Cyanidium caldarium]|uniref:Uncharacterized protein n=1 Tax=Cyanidium caldarium TaxID=2771 RepID=A0AAV9IRV6_CYACA|nr:hypothetical protein CDCA_CDCA03G0845 [Cyanidium caldarium]|eukprot:ctg_762.g375
MHTTSSPLQAVVFDLDGVLLDTEPLYIVAEQAIVDAYAERPGDVRQLTPQLLGTSAVDSARRVIDTYRLGVSVEAYLQERDRILCERLSQVRLLPGARRWSDHLQRVGVPQAIATSSSRAMWARKLAVHAEFFRRFDGLVVCNDDVERGKPAPDIFLAALARLQQRTTTPLEAARTWVFEDAPAGVLGAKRAGMPCVAVRNEHTPVTAYAAADKVLGSLVDVRPEWFGLPPYIQADGAVDGSAELPSKSSTAGP